MLSSSSSVGENQNPSSCEMDQKLISLQGDKQSRSSSEEPVHQSIKKMISKPVKELIAECRAKRKEIDSSDASEPTTLSEPFQRQEDQAASSDTVKKPKGRRIKNVVVGEKEVFFTLPDDFNENIKDIEKVKERLGKWRIQRRRRGSKLTDTYYRHMKSSLTFRSIKEVSNFICHESVPVISQKRKQVGTVASAESCSKKLKEGSPNVKEAISEELVENVVDSINPTENAMDSINDDDDDAKSVIINSNSGDDNIWDYSHLDKFYCDLQLQTYEELNHLQFEPCDDLPTIFSRKDHKAILKENSTEMQDLAWIETDAEANILTTEEATSSEESQKVKGNSEAEGKVEEEDFKDDIYDQLQDLNMGSKRSDYYDIFDYDDFVEYDLLNNTPFDVDVDVPNDLVGK